LAAQASGVDTDPVIAALRAELAAKERAVSDSLAEVERMRAQLAEERASVEKQVSRMNELGRKVKEDSERLAEQARALRAVAASTAGANAAASPFRLAAQEPDASLARSPGDASGVDEAALRADAATVSNITRSQALVKGVGGNVGYLGNQISSQGTAQVTSTSTSTAKPSSSANVGSSSAASTAKAILSSEAPNELFEPDVMALFDRYKKPLYSLFSFYVSMSSPQLNESSASGLDVKRFVEMYCDYDIAPTFLTRRELKAIFATVASVRR
jgi:hypothetical protein